MPQQGVKIFLRHRLAKQETLNAVQRHGTHRLVFLPGFHPFQTDRDPYVMAKLHNKADKGTVEGAVPDVPYKGPVYLDNIRMERKLSERASRL